MHLRYSWIWPFEYFISLSFFPHLFLFKNWNGTDVLGSWYINLIGWETVMFSHCLGLVLILQLSNSSFLFLLVCICFRDKLITAPYGFDKFTWDPSKDKFLPENYSADNMKGKAVCKVTLQQHLGLTEHATVILVSLHRIFLLISWYFFFSCCSFGHGFSWPATWCFCVSKLELPFHFKPTRSLIIILSWTLIQWSRTKDIHGTSYQCLWGYCRPDYDKGMVLLKIWLCQA